MNLNEWSWHMSHEQVDDFDQPMLAWIKTLRESCNIWWYLMWYDIWCGMMWLMCWWAQSGPCAMPVMPPSSSICSDLHIFASLALDSSSLLPRELKDCRWRYRQKSANLDAQSTVQLTMNMIKHGTQNNSTNHCATSHKNHWGNRLLKHLPKANSLQRMESAWSLPPGNAWGDRTPAGFLVVSPTRAVTRCH